MDTTQINSTALAKSFLLVLNCACLALAGLFSCTEITQAQPGALIWANSYNGPASGGELPYAIAIGSNDNVYVTGESQQESYYGLSYGYATVAYSSSGTPLWTNRYDDPPHQNFGERIAVGNNGDVYVSGAGPTIAYSSTGIPLWTNSFGGVIAVGNNGDVYVAGQGDYDLEYKTVAYSSGGALLWEANYNGSTNDDYPTAIAVGKNGNVYVTGGSGGSASAADFATVAYTSEGAPLWTNRYDGADDEDYATGIALDNQGRIYVTGLSLGGYAKGRIFGAATIAYTAEGVPIWTNRTDELDYTIDGHNIGISTNGEIYVAGDNGVIAYSREGVPLWTNILTAGTISAMTVDDIGNVYVTGTIRGGMSGSLAVEYVLTVAYSRTGNELWSRATRAGVNGAGSSDDIALDSAGSVYVAADVYMGSIDSMDYETIKYASLSSSASNQYGDFSYLVTNETVTITAYTGAGGYLAIPDSIDGFPVTTIGSNAFYGCDTLYSITIPANINDIESKAFAGCNLLRASYYEGDSPVLGSGVFNNVYSSVDNPFPTVYYQLGTAGWTNTFGGLPTALWYAPGWFIYTVTNGAISISTYIGNNGSYTSLGTPETIPNVISGLTVTGIGDYAFAWSSLAGVTIPGSVTNIADSAFYDCPDLAAVYFEGNAPTVDPTSFTNDNNLVVYYLPGTTGWGDFSLKTGISVVPWNPQVETAAASFGLLSHQFGFGIAGTNGLAVVVEASTNLANPVWLPVATNTLTGGASYFSDPRWTNYPARFYRLNMP